MKKVLFCLLAVGFLGGCATKEEPKDVAYDWAPPFEEVRWSMGEDAVFETLDLDEEDVTLNVNPEKQRVFSFTSAMETEVGLAAPNFIFEPDFGLVGVTLSYMPMEEEAAETLAKLEAAYGKSDDGTWSGTKFGDLNLSDEQVAAFKKEADIDKDEPVVTIALNQDAQAVKYQECVFEGKNAAILEQVLAK